VNVMIVGATGFIGARLVQACLAAGHGVVCAGRSASPQGPRCAHLSLDYAALPPAEVLVHSLRGVDVVVNAVGIIREGRGRTFEALHVRGPAALFAACVTAGVRRIVQISALGADERAESRYHRTKLAADRALAALPLDWAIVQPSLVYGAGGASARLFETLASLPLIPLPAGGVQRVQPVHVEDLVAALLRLIESPATLRCVLPVVGPIPLSLRQYLLELRAALGLAPGRTIAIPRPLVAAAARLGDYLPAAPLDRETWAMLERGNFANPAPLESLLDRPALPVARFVSAERRTERGVAASLRWLAPLLRAAVAVMWIVAGVVSLWLYPVERSLALLGQVGIPPGLAPVALWGAAALDIVFGLLTLWPRRARWLWTLQILVVLGYTAIISCWLPGLWLEPFGPVAKNLPILALLLTLRELERRD
jgi:uncharacterized protein YbjT (DUF2867 family)/uncharacterized membrane protein YphA (DoxX/SURF4 family)